MNKSEKIILIIIILLLVIALAVVLCVYGYFSDWFSRKATRLFVSNNGVNYHEDSILVVGNSKFDVHYFGIGGFTVKVLSEGDFTYTVDGETMHFEDLKNLNEPFEVKQSHGSFTLKARFVTLQNLLEKVYPDKVVVVPKDLDAEPHFSLVVSTNDGKRSLKITFRCLMPSDYIQLSPDRMAF